MPETLRRDIDLLGNTVEYQVRQSADATEPRIDVDIHGVTVVLPEADDSSPEELLRENAAWILDKVRAYERHREQAPDRMFEAGEWFLYLGDERELVIEPRQAHAVDEEAIRLRQSAVDQSSVERVLENFYRTRARSHFSERVDHFAQQMGVSYKQLELRNQRTRWGSCSTGGTLSLNWRLIMAPPEVVDYIIVHELAHLTEQNHGPEFWDTVAGQVPDYQAKADWLTENSSRLIFSEADL